MKFLNEVFVSPLIKEEVLDEKTGAKKLYITGVFAEADTKNKNNRIYPKKIMERGVDRYIKEYVETNRSIGEINHPDRIQVDPNLASHKITELHWEGNKLIGKALVLNTPSGNILRGLLEGDVNIGVSLRSAGSLKRRSDGINEVQDDWTLSCWDCVANPSFEAYMNPVMESKEYAYVDGQFVEISEDVLEKMGYQKKDVNKKVFNEAEMLKNFEKLAESISKK